LIRPPFLSAGIPTKERVFQSVIYQLISAYLSYAEQNSLAKNAANGPDTCQFIAICFKLLLSLWVY
jgi:hypothetical protein